MLRLGSNISSQRAQRALQRSSEELSGSMGRLASGMRINSASDDAAGLSVSAGLNHGARLFTQAIRNINDGMSLINIADSALRELDSVTTRQKELAEQAANGSYSNQQRLALHNEASALTSEYNRILGTTTFNGLQLFTTNSTSLRLQAGTGADSDSQLAIDLGPSRASTSYTPLGTFGTATAVGSGSGTYGVIIADLNRDGINDIATAEANSERLSIYLGNGDGTFKSGTSYAANGGMDLRSADINGDSILDIIMLGDAPGTINTLLGNGDGSFKAPVSFQGITASPAVLTLADFDNDGRLDAATNLYGGGAIAVYRGNGDGTFKAGVNYDTGCSHPTGVTTGDFNDDGILDLLAADACPGTVSLLLGNGNGTFKARVTFQVGAGSTDIVVEAADLNKDGNADIVVGSVNGNITFLLGNGNGTFGAARTISGGSRLEDIKVLDINGDGSNDIVAADNTTNRVRIHYGNGDGTFKAALSLSSGSGTSRLALGDLNGDLVFDIATANDNSNNVSVFLQNSLQQLGLNSIDLRTQATARDALTTLTATQDALSLQRGSLGASQSRLSSSLRSLTRSREEFLAASSRITDADVAAEASQMVKAQVIQRSAASVLAQANQSPSLVLQLLK